MDIDKYIYTIGGHSHTYSTVLGLKDVPDTLQDLVHMNNELHAQLVVQKNAITQYHKNKKWDKFKKLTNEYELIFTSTQGCPSISKHVPISRSFFKLWEILKDFEVEMNLPSCPVNAVFLADAPGGFCEAFVRYRAKMRSFKRLDDTQKDRSWTMSLRATHKIIPDWKLTPNFCKENNLTISWGSDGQGDLYNVDNIDYIVSSVGEHSCALVTADGGFDFSSDFNHQENMSFRLILSEIYTALRLQKVGGSFVLKIFDIHCMNTVKILFILKLFYSQLHFVKPLSSRPANSEKYVICTGFMNNHESSLVLSFILEELRQQVETKCQHFTEDFKFLKIPYSFMYDIVEYNRIYIAFQVSHIGDTLEMINNKRENKIQIATRVQLEKAIRWCHKYGIETDTRSILAYKQVYNY